MTTPLAPDFDLAIIGAGVSGLCLSWMVSEKVPRARVLLVDGARDEDELRTLSFWSTGPIELEELVRHRWTTMGLELGSHRHELPLARYSYRTLFFADLQREAKARLGRGPHNRIVEGRVREVVEDGEGVWIHVADQRWRASWVCDSRFSINQLRVSPRFHALRQHFHGWVVRAGRPVWEPRVATLFDFRVDGAPGTAFVYVLPHSPTEALVELVTLEAIDAEPVLRSYLLRAFGLSELELLDREAGVSPMTEQPFPWRGGRRVRRIGIAGGRVKPSTGYALTRILEDTRGLVRSLEQEGHPMVPPPRDGLFRVLDAVMLEVWDVEPHRIPGIFAALFTRNSPDVVLRFLDQASSLWDVVRVGASLPSWPMLRAVGRWLRRRLGLTPAGASRAAPRR